MPISFPTSPANGDTHVIGSITYQYDSTDDKWTGLGVTPSDRLVEGSNSLEIDANNDLVWTGNDLKLTDGKLLHGETYNSEWGAGLISHVPQSITDVYFRPSGQYTASLGKVNNTNTTQFISVDSSYNQTSAVSAGILLSAFHADLGGSGCGFTIKNLTSDASGLVFSSVTTASSANNPAVETERLRITSGGTLFSYSPDDTTPNFKWRSDDTNWHGALNVSVEGGSIASFWSTGGDWSVNGTTYSCTKNLAAYPSAAIALHNQYNSSFESKLVFLNKAGGSTTTDGGIAELASISSAGIISDSIGPLRRLGIQGSNSSFTLAADHAGKLVRSTGNGSTLTIPQNVFSAGDMISIFNVSTGDNTIAQGTGATLYNTADGATGNRTLGPKGVCTILCTSTNEFVISGSQVS